MFLTGGDISRHIVQRCSQIDCVLFLGSLVINVDNETRRHAFHARSDTTHKGRQHTFCVTDHIDTVDTVDTVGTIEGINTVGT